MASSPELLDMPMGDEGIRNNPETYVLPAQEIVTDITAAEIGADPDLDQIRLEIDRIFEEIALTGDEGTNIDMAKRKQPSPFGPGRGTPGPLPGRRPGPKRHNPGTKPLPKPRPGPLPGKRPPRRSR